MASSSCSQVLKLWPLAPEHHLLKLVIDSAQEHLDRVKDAGWLYVQLSLGLYRGLQGCGGALEALARASVRLEQGIQELRRWVEEQNMRLSKKEMSHGDVDVRLRCPLRSQARRSPRPTPISRSDGRQSARISWSQLA